MHAKQRACPTLPCSRLWTAKRYVGKVCLSRAQTASSAVQASHLRSSQVAKRVDAAIEAHERDPLAVMIQVNTSGEETKFGVEPAEAVTLATYIHEQCKHLRLAGLMTIGQPDYTSRPENFEVDVTAFQCVACV